MKYRKLERSEVFWLVVFLFGAVLTCLSGCSSDDSGTGDPLAVPDPNAGRPTSADAGAGAVDGQRAVDMTAGEAAPPATADAGPETTPPATADAGPEAPAILPQCPGSAARVIVCGVGASRGTCSAYNPGEKIAPIWGCFIRDDNDWHFVCVEACP